MPETENIARPSAPDTATESQTTAPPPPPPVVGTHPAAPAGMHPDDADSTLVRVCPKCSVQERTTGDFCPHCGARYERRRRRLGKRTKIAIAVVLGACLLSGAGVGVALKIRHDDRVAAHAAAEKKRRAAEAQAQRQRQQEQAETARLERDSRDELVKSLQDSITKDAKKDVNNGLLDGPILRSSCSAAGDAGDPMSDLTVTSASYECLAVTKDNADLSSSGYRFSANVNFDDGSYTWHLGG